MTNIQSFSDAPVYVGTVLAVIVILIVGSFWTVAKLKRLFRQWAFGDARADIRRAWSDVEKLMARSDDMSAKLAVMNADAALDKALQAKHFPGDRFATRLQFAQKKYRTLRKVWWAHKLRNDLAHELNHNLRHTEARRAVATFKSALKDLGAL